MPTLTPSLWFDSEAEEAARHYVSIFPNSSIDATALVGAAGHEVHGKPEGSVLAVYFRLDGKPFMAINGGPVFHFTEAVSLMVECETQAELDYYWERLGAGGDPEAQQCGWLKDKYGLSWQIVPRLIAEVMSGPDAAAANRMMEALLPMQKLDVATLQAAVRGETEQLPSA